MEKAECKLSRVGVKVTGFALDIPEDIAVTRHQFKL
jgi:hypothetical protein